MENFKPVIDLERDAFHKTIPSQDRTRVLYPLTKLYYSTSDEMYKPRW